MYKIILKQNSTDTDLPFKWMKLTDQSYGFIDKENYQGYYLTNILF